MYTNLKANIVFFDIVICNPFWRRDMLYKNATYPFFVQKNNDYDKIYIGL